MQGTLVVDWLEDKQDGGFIFFRNFYRKDFIRLERTEFAKENIGRYSIMALLKHPNQ